MDISHRLFEKVFELMWGIVIKIITFWTANDWTGKCSGMKNPKRKTKRLIIRALADKDFMVWRQAYLQMNQPKNTWDHGPKKASEVTRADFNKILGAQKKMRREDKFYDLAIFNFSGELVGFVAIMEVARGISQTAYLGYRIFNNYWRSGYGKEAVRAMIDIGFREIKLHRIEAGIEPGNIRSMKLARSLGMRREGLKKRALFLRGMWVDLIMYTLTTEDFGIKFDTKSLKHKLRA